jgi:hypothetical protein
MSAVGVPADQRVASLDDVVDFGAKVLERGNEVSEDGDRAVLAGRGVAVVIDVLVV